MNPSDIEDGGPADAVPPAPARPPIRRYLLLALAAIAVFFGGFGTWATLAPLDSAAVAPARVTVAGNRKTVQHLEGGIVREILVEEGDRVAAGEVLVRLDETLARAMVDQLRGRYDNLLAREARLLVERDPNAEEILFPETLSSRRDRPDIAAMLAGEQAIFEAQREYLEGRKRILEQQETQLRKEIESLGAQVTGETRQLELVGEEKEAIEELFAKGMVDKPRLMAAKRAEARLQGDLGEHLALIARTEQRIGETDLEIIDLKNRFLNDVVTQLKQTQADMTELTQRLKAAEATLARTEIRAPVGGRVVALSVHTEGGVVGTGERILDIVPEDDALELEARIDPDDIDVVHPGLNARVILTAYKQRSTPALIGRVSRVSADSFSDPQTGQTYYLARIRVAPEELARMENIELYPGMQAEVMIRTGQSTLLKYVLAPITQSMRRAFRES